MQSRTRKYRKQFDTYQQAIQKQLNDDFQVCQYLSQNQLQGNIEEYLKLFNSLQVNKNHKRKNYNLLNATYHQMNAQRIEINLQSSKVQNWDEEKEEYAAQYEESQVKTCNQIQVKNTLLKQIIETKKSLNLLKGDIGHLINRNESANLLKSKISKVKLVADDQLKRVSLTYSKDKDEMRQSRDMQRNFNKKLKHVSMLENSALNRLKQKYIKTMVKKKQIHVRLAKTEKMSTSIAETWDKERLKNQINKSTLQMHSNFVKLSNLIEKMPAIQTKYGQSKGINEFVNDLYSHCFTSNEINQESMKNLKGKQKNQYDQMQQINSDDLQIISKQGLKELEKKIITQHHKIVEATEKYALEYDCQVKKSQEVSEKLEDCNEQIKRIQDGLLDQMNQKYLLTQEMKLDYSERLNNLRQSMKTVFVLLQYIEKTLNYSSQASHLPNHHASSSPDTQIYPQENSSNILRAQSNNSNQRNKASNLSKTHITSYNSIVLTQKSYISELYKIYYTLLKDEDSEMKLSSINKSLFDFLKLDIKEWMGQIREKIFQEKRRFLAIGPRNFHNVFHSHSKIPQHCSNSRISKLRRSNTLIKSEEQEIKEVQQQYQEYLQNYQRHTIHQDTNLTEHHSYNNANAQTMLRKPTNGLLSMNRKSQQPSFQQASGLINISKLKNCSSHSLNDKKAMRIRFLQDLDKNYYKMLKSTMNMEKQNIRKNFEFMKTFKQTKYSQNDSIIEEKRFQSSFSMIFLEKKDAGNMKEEHNAKKSCFFNSTNSLNRLSKPNHFKKQLSSSQFLRNSISTSNFNEKVTNELKKNIREFKQNIKKTKIKAHERKEFFPNRHLSIQMRDILNLV